MAKDSAARTGIRGRLPALDHLIRGYGRYQADGGDRLAAGVTYFGFLSFFPLVALAFSVAGFVVEADPHVQQQLTSHINSFLPGLSDKLDIASIGSAKVAAGIVGIVGLLLSGLGWVSALRDALRILWHHNIEAGNFVVKKVRDTVVLVGLGLTLLASVAVSGAATAATQQIIEAVGLDGNVVASVVTRVLAIVVAIAIDLAVFVYLFTRLPRLDTPRRRVMRGALLGAVGLEILKSAGTYLVGRTTSNPVYGAFAVIVGLLIWINLTTRWTLFVAAWTVTAAYDSDVAPSGTASPQAAREAGIPQDYVSDDPDDVATTTGGGAPAPLTAALQGREPVQKDGSGGDARTT